MCRYSLMTMEIQRVYIQLAYTETDVYTVVYLKITEYQASLQFFGDNGVCLLQIIMPHGVSQCWPSEGVFPLTIRCPPTPQGIFPSLLPSPPFHHHLSCLSILFSCHSNPFMHKQIYTTFSPGCIVSK